EFEPSLDRCRSCSSDERHFGGTDRCTISERDQVVAWYAYEVIFYAGLVEDKPVEEALDAAVLEFAKDGYHYPEHLEKYAYGQARAAFNKALRKDETDELIDGLESNLKALS
ncbi:MAG: hypothetical protein EBS90_10015, partial [Betaproteobacteria bacterium]|nr:hypothetical protein [Betaproteobacteria bacterium]